MYHVSISKYQCVISDTCITIVSTMVLDVYQAVIRNTCITDVLRLYHMCINRDTLLDGDTCIRGVSFGGRVGRGKMYVIHLYYLVIYVNTPVSSSGLLDVHIIRP